MPLSIAHDLNVLSPVIAVTLTALAVLVADWFLPEEDPRGPAALSVVGLVAAGLLLLRNRGMPDTLAFTMGARTADGSTVTVGLLRQDGFALFVEAVLLAVALLVVLISVDYVRRRGIARAEYFVLVLLATAGMMLLAMANDLVVLFLVLETFSIALYVLAGFVRNERLSQEAALKYFVLGSFSAGCLLYGTALVYAVTGSTNLDQIGAVVAALFHSLPALAYVALALVMVGLGFKIAMAPFHQWTPDVYEGAPLSVTAFMATATKTAAFAALLRVLWTGFGPMAGAWLPLLAGLAVLTMFVGNLAALVQSDMKRMLAFSAIAHAGYILVAVLAGPPNGTAAALYYFVAYALMNIGAFTVLMAIGSTEPGSPDASNLNHLAGLSRRQPWLALALAIFLFALTGFPPTVGFLAKWYVFQAAVSAGLAWLAVAVVVNSVISAFYYLRPVLVMYLSAPESDERIELATPSAIVVAVTALVVGLGVVLTVPLVRGAQVASMNGPQRAPAGAEGTTSGLYLTAPEVPPVSR